MTVKTRISLLIIGAGLVSSLIFSVVVFIEMIEQPFEVLDAVLKEEAYRATRMIMTKEKESGSVPLDYPDDASYSYWIEIYEQDVDRMLYQSGLAKLVKLPQVKPGLRTIAEKIIPRELIDLDQDRRQEVAFRIRTFLVPLNGRVFVVQIARPMEKLEEEIWALVLGICSGFIFSCIFLIVISYFLAGKILKPIGKMKDLTRQISERNLEKRIPTGQGRDEFNELARTINWMLDRLQKSFVTQRNFLFDTSHELKTPLTTMRLAIDEICVSETENLSASEKESFFELNNHVLRMERMVKDLLNLSSLETMSVIDRKPVHMIELLSSLATEYRVLADDRKIQMDIQLAPQLSIQGDMEKLNRAFSNILDNAIKYNVDGGRIKVVGTQSEDDLTITIANTGPGVAEAEIDKVFDQFYRVEKSRSFQHGGSGLGLSIVKRIIELHNGKVTFESRQGDWTRVIVSLPRGREM